MTSTPAEWTTVAPEVMTLEQLSQAAHALKAKLNEIQAVTTPINQAYLRVSAHIADKMSVPISGVPPLETLPPYPAEFVGSYDWTVDEPEDDTVPAEDQS